jgi:hypothetical protein
MKYTFEFGESIRERKASNLAYEGQSLRLRTKVTARRSISDGRVRAFHKEKATASQTISAPCGTEAVTVPSTRSEY